MTTDIREEVKNNRPKHDLSECEEFRLFPPLCNDGEEMRELSLMCYCTKCAVPAPVHTCSVCDCHHPLGYKMERLRVTTKCENCDNRDTFRMRWMVVENGCFVKKDDI